MWYSRRRRTAALFRVVVPSVCFTPWSGVRIPLTTAPASLPCTPLFVAMRHLPPTGGSPCSLAAVSSAAIPVRVKLKIPRANAAAATTLDIPSRWDLQQRRPRPVADAGRSCWGSGQQDASAAQGTMRMLGAATRWRRPFQIVPHKKAAAQTLCSSLNY